MEIRDILPPVDAVAHYSRIRLLRRSKETQHKKRQEEESKKDQKKGPHIAALLNSES
ncbi:MAG: hypothetical protein ACJAYE_000456 [Candidatus Azotimanducaceae bacterium]|jgi:hypothetical protein